MTTQLINKPQYKYRILAAIVPLLLLTSSFVMVSLASSNIAKRNQNLTDANQKKQAYDEAESLNQYVAHNLTSLEKMSMAIPSESMMVGVVQDIESVVVQFDPQGVLKLSGQNPVLVGQELIIPFTIQLRIDSDQLPKFIDQLNALPYITQILTTDIQIAESTTQTLINMRMYVQNPFTDY